MRTMRVILAGLLLLAGQAQAASDYDSDWQLLGRVLSLVQSVVHGAAQSDDPRALEKGVDRLLSGGNREANRIGAEFLGEALADMPPQYRGAAISIVQDLTTIARKERERQNAPAYQRTEPAPAGY